MTSSCGRRCERRRGHPRGRLGRCPHGFLGRRGGVSTGDCAGLNVGYGSQDDRAAIAENRRRAVAAVLPGRRARYRPSGSFGRSCRLPTTMAAGRAAARRCDGDRPPGHPARHPDRRLRAGSVRRLEAGVVGAAHAGWRGALAGVTDATIEAMERLGARRERIAAAVGPCIAQSSYEVDEAFRPCFLDTDSPTCASSSPARKGSRNSTSRAMSPIASAAGSLRSRGVGLDTYADPDRFYSFRRATHRGEADYGRQVSLIGLHGNYQLDRVPRRGLATPSKENQLAYRRRTQRRA